MTLMIHIYLQMIWMTTKSQCFNPAPPPRKETNFYIHTEAIQVYQVPFSQGGSGLTKWTAPRTAKMNVEYLLLDFKTPNCCEPLVTFYSESQFKHRASYKKIKGKKGTCNQTNQLFSRKLSTLSGEFHMVSTPRFLSLAPPKRAADLLHWSALRYATNALEVGKKNVTVVTFNLPKWLTISSRRPQLDGYPPWN